MRVKSEQAGEGARPPPFTTSTITFSVVVYTLAERAVTLLLFLLYHDLYSVFRTEDKGVVLVFNGFWRIDFSGKKTAGIIPAALRVQKRVSSPSLFPKASLIGGH
jgi:hypothetical protein